MKTYIINLTASHERRYHMTAQMKKHGITDYEFIEAETQPSPAEGCMKSHRKVWQLIADSGSPAIVLEDDVVLHDSFYHFIHLRTQPQFTQYIEVGLIGYQVKGNPLWNNTGPHWRSLQANYRIEYNGAYGYFVNGTAPALKLIDLSTHVNAHPDMMMMNEGNNSRLALYFMNFPLVQHGSFPSTLQHGKPKQTSDSRHQIAPPPPTPAVQPATTILPPETKPAKPRKIDTKLTITLLHPSRGRAVKAKETLDYWLKASSQQIKIEHIISIDDDDSQFAEYEKLFPVSKTANRVFKFYHANNDCVVQATNHAATFSTGNILVYLSDDFKCPENWDVELLHRFTGKRKPMLLQVADGINPFGIPCLTIPVMNRQLYKKLGYFWHPAYKSMFVDNDLFWTCYNHDWLIMAPELTFVHEHPANNKMKVETDATYQRSSAHWNSGQATFNERKDKGFALK